MVTIPKESKGQETRSEAGAKTVMTALRMLTLFTHTSPEWTVKELAHAMNLPYSTTYRYVSTLEFAGFLTRDPAAGTCRIGLPLIELGGLALQQLDVRMHGLNYLDHLADATGFNANLAVLYQGDVLHVAYAIRSEATPSYYGVLGRRSPAHCTALGKAILANLPFDEVRRLIEQYGWRPYTPHSIRTFQDLERDLAETRQRGYALDIFERSMGTNCVAAAIRERSGGTAGAISVSVPKSRLSKVDMLGLGGTVLDYAAMISHHLGYHDLLTPQWV